MTNIIDYLSWRGDLRFSQSGLCEIDMLIFAQLVHAPLERLGDGGPGMTLAELMPLVYPEPPDKDANVLEQKRFELWTAASACTRFSGVTLGSFESHFEPEREKQFAAAMFMLGGMGVAAFRGTDATLVGWKEDFNMSFESPIPSQNEAVEFINETGQGVHTLYVCGHSKGGNLALYSSSMCDADKRSRIKGVYSFDGPGLDDATVRSDGYKELEGRIHSYVPESSIIGLLMDYHDEYFVVESDGVSIWQHNPYLWHVNGSHFVAAENTTRSSRFTDATLHAFLSDCSTDERRALVDTLYDILSASKAVRLRDLPRGLAMHAPAVYEACKDVPQATRAVLKKTLSALVSAGSENLSVLFGTDDRHDDAALPSDAPASNDAGLPM